MTPSPALLSDFERGVEAALFASTGPLSPADLAAYVGAGASATSGANSGATSGPGGGDLAAQIAHAGHPQERCKVGHLAAVGQDLVMEQHDQRIGRAAFFFGHLGQGVPHQVFQPDAGQHTVDADGARTLLVLNGVPKFSILGFNFFFTQIPNV